MLSFPNPIFTPRLSRLSHLSQVEDSANVPSLKLDGTPDSSDSNHTSFRVSFWQQQQAIIQA